MEITEEAQGLVLDWGPTILDLVRMRQGGADCGSLAGAFHEALAGGIATIARRLGVTNVLLTGGCFQNARLTETAVGALRRAGHAPYWHHRIPPNDGGLAVGQCVYALNPLVEEKV